MEKRLIIENVGSNDCYDPRDNDNMWTLACWHHRYKLGDIQPEIPMKEFINNLPEGTTIYSLQLYEHSGITISLTEFSCRWDSGQVGIAYLTKKDLIKEYGEYSPDSIKRAVHYLRGEIQEYDDFLRGNVWRFRAQEWEGCECCKRGEWKTFESCGGFIGSELEQTGLLEDISGFTEEEIKAAWDKRLDILN